MRYALTSKKARKPEYATEGSAGLDFWAADINITEEYIEYDTHVIAEIPPGYVGFLFALSSVTKTDIVLKNGVGVIDSDYRGTIRFRFQESSSYIKKYLKPVLTLIEDVMEIIASKTSWGRFHTDEGTKKFNRATRKVKEDANIYNIGDRIGQMVIVPVFKTSLQETTEDQLTETERGTGNFGHTNEKVYIPRPRLPHGYNPRQG